MRDLVSGKFNSKLRNKRENKPRDPIEKEVDDVVVDDDNEFISGIVALPSEMEEQCAPHGAAQEQEQSTSKAR